MGRSGVPGPQNRDHRRGHRKAGIQVKARSGRWHLVGTVRVKGCAVRVRESTGLPARPELWDDADAIRRRREQEIHDEVIHGIKPSVPVAIAADRYLARPRSRPLNPTHVRHIQWIVQAFGKRTLSSIKDREWVEWVDRRQAGNRAETRERFLNTVCGFLAWCRKKPREWIDALPDFERDRAARNPTTRARRRVGELSPALIALMIEHAAPHLKGQLAAEWSTGARGSSILHGCRVCDLILAEGREQISFHNTKNGKTVRAALHPWAADRLREYVEWRGDLHDREAPLFVTNRKDRNGRWLPYAETAGAWGAQNKTAFNAMKRRTARTIRSRAAAQARILLREGKRAEARETIEQAKAEALLVRQITQHWFRHNMASQLLAKGDLRAAMEQGGWDDPRSLMGYTTDIPERRRALVAALDAPDSGGFRTHEAETQEKTA